MHVCIYSMHVCMLLCVHCAAVLLSLMGYIKNTSSGVDMPGPAVMDVNLLDHCCHTILTFKYLNTFISLWWAYAYIYFT